MFMYGNSLYLKWGKCRKQIRKNNTMWGWFLSLRIYEFPGATRKWYQLDRVSRTFQFQLTLQPAKFAQEEKILLLFGKRMEITAAIQIRSEILNIGDNVFKKMLCKKSQQREKIYRLRRLIPSCSAFYRK